MPTPLQSFLGGIGLALSTHIFLLLNGGVFGISGFLHRSIRGDREALASVIGLILGGMVAVECNDPPQPETSNLRNLVLSGLLVGVGTRMGNGCTSGHMICGLSRFSIRSIVATTTFFSVAALTVRFAHGNTLSAAGSLDYTLSPVGETLFVLQSITLPTTAFIFLLAPFIRGRDHFSHSNFLRFLASLATSFNFALALRLSTFTQPSRAISFLILPLHPGFDISLLYLAAGALPLAAFLYHFARFSEKPWLGGVWEIPKDGKVDKKLVIGAAIFGIGWGMGGVCPGPGLVNLGSAVLSGKHVMSTVIWIGSVIIGGLVV